MWSRCCTATGSPIPTAGSRIRTVAETAAWVEAQNKVTFGYLEKIEKRAAIRERLTKLWNYERYGVPSREGSWTIFSKNDGLQNQAVIYKADVLDRDSRGAARSQHPFDRRHGGALRDEFLRGREARGLRHLGVGLRLDGVEGARRGHRQGSAGHDQVVEVLGRLLEEGRQRLLLLAATTRR